MVDKPNDKPADDEPEDFTKPGPSPKVTPPASPILGDDGTPVADEDADKADDTK